MLDLIYVLDLIGTFAFACYGCYYAMQKSLDLIGIFLCAFLTGVGGGTVRELILDKTPFYYFDYNYLYIIGIGIIFTICMYKHFNKINGFMLRLDAIGLSVFAYIGASIAANAGLGWFPIVFLATLTSVGGGLIRDTITNNLPEILYKDFYATVAIMVGLIYALFYKYFDSIIFDYSLIAFGYFLRVIAIRYSLHIWRPSLEQEKLPFDS